MHATTTCKFIFRGSSERLESAADFFEKQQRGEYFFDEEDNLVLVIEEDLEMCDKEAVISFIEKLYKRFKKKIDIHALGTLYSVTTDAQQRFECQCTKHHFRYRETEWSNNLDVSEGLSYEEYEEGSHMDIDEDEYDEYVHRAHDGISNNSGNTFGDWDYLD